MISTVVSGIVVTSGVVSGVVVTGTVGSISVHGGRTVGKTIKIVKRKWQHKKKKFSLCKNNKLKFLKIKFNLLIEVKYKHIYFKAL